MTTEEIQKARTVAEGAKRFKAWLEDQARELGRKAERIFIWSPQESAARGYGRAWSVCWEEGPYEWTMVGAGCTLCGPELGLYSNPGPFPSGIDGSSWHAEAYNNFIMQFFQD